MDNKKAPVIPIDKDWHMKLGTKKTAAKAKARAALHAVESREALRLVQRRRVARIPATGWAAPDERLYSFAELAKHFGCSEMTLRRAEQRGELVAEPCGKNGKIKRFSRSAVDAYKTFLARKRYG